LNFVRCKTTAVRLFYRSHHLNGKTSAKYIID
jgi:hypothetical protein